MPWQNNVIALPALFHTLVWFLDQDFHNFQVMALELASHSNDIFLLILGDD